MASWRQRRSPAPPQPRQNRRGRVALVATTAPGSPQPRPIGSHAPEIKPQHTSSSTAVSAVEHCAGEGTAVGLVAEVCTLEAGATRSISFSTSRDNALLRDAHHPHSPRASPPFQERVTITEAGLQSVNDCSAGGVLSAHCRAPRGTSEGA